MYIQRCLFLLLNKTIIKMPNKKQTSVKEATLASKVLTNPKSSALDKKLAGSVLAQARGKKKS